MNIIQHNYIPVTNSTLHIVHNIPEDDSVLGGGHLHVSFDVGKVVRRKYYRLNRWIVSLQLIFNQSGILG